MYFIKKIVSINIQKFIKYFFQFFLIFVFSYYINTENVCAVDNPIILAEIEKWKLYSAETYSCAFFPCGMIDCTKYNIRDGLHKCFFYDGFVLSLYSNGEVFRYYYTLSDNNVFILKQIYKAYKDYIYITPEGEIKIKDGRFNKNQEKRLKALYEYIHGDYLKIFKDLNAYLTKGDLKSALEYLNKIKIDSFIGIGIYFGTTNIYPYVLEVIEGSPAEKANIEIGDKIIKINGQSCEKWDLNKIYQSLQGAEGTNITLTIAKSEKDIKDITIKRGKIIDRKFLKFMAIRAFLYKNLGEKENFHADAEEAYSLDPNDNWAKIVMVYSLFNKGENQKADEILSTIKENPSDTESSYNRTFNNLVKIAMGYLFFSKGDNQSADKILSSIKENIFETDSPLNILFTSLADILKPYKQLKRQLISQLEIKGQYKEAIKEYANLLKIANEQEAKEIRTCIAELMMKYPHLFALSEDARKIIIKAELYTSEGNFEKAIEEYKKALEISPFFPGLYKALALNYGQIKDYKNAIKNMNIYLELVPDAQDYRAVKDQIYRWEFMMEKEK